MTTTEAPSVLRLDRVLRNGRILFCRDGVYFSLSRAQVKELVGLVEKLDEGKKDE